jgi:hypothetical protein
MASRMPVTVTVIMAARANRQLEWLRVGPQGSLRTAQWLSWRSGRRCDIGTVAAGPRGTESDLLGINMIRLSRSLCAGSGLGPATALKFKSYSNQKRILFLLCFGASWDSTLSGHPRKAYHIRYRRRGHGGALAGKRRKLAINFEWAPKKDIAHQTSQQGP